MFSRRLCRSLTSIYPRAYTTTTYPRSSIQRLGVLGWIGAVSRVQNSFQGIATSAQLGKQRDDKGLFDGAAESLVEEKKKAKTENKAGVETEIEKKEREHETASDESRLPEKTEESTSEEEIAEELSSEASSVGDGGSGSSGTGSSSESSFLGDDGPADFGRRRRGPHALAKIAAPDTYPEVMAIPITKRPLFPGFYKAVTIRDPQVCAAIAEMQKKGQPYIGAFLFKDDNKDGDVIQSADDVHDVGVFAQITSAWPLNDGQGPYVAAVLYPHRRIRLNKLIPPGAGRGGSAAAKVQMEADGTAGGSRAPDVPEPIPSSPKAAVPSSTAEALQKEDVVATFEEGAMSPKFQSSSQPENQTSTPPPTSEPASFLRKYPVSIVKVEDLEEVKQDPKSPAIRALTSEIVTVFKEVANLNSLFRDQVTTFAQSQQTGNVAADPAKLADFAAAVSVGESAELQEVMESPDIEQRLHKALIVLKKEWMNAQLQTKIAKDVENKITKRQREYWLMEQLKSIKRELGIESDGKDKLIATFKESANKLTMPEAVKKVFDDEINKLSSLEATASEFNVTRNYLDWLTQIPWGQRSAENFSIKNAKTVLDEDHHGLQDVKDRILEFVAVGKLRGTVEGKILCFVGPPGVGKTSIAKSIARALNRQYYRFSVGGLSDVAEVKGHRRTYVGALPGRLIQALKKCQTENPLILIDELDKLGKGHQGDPGSALLELLDPEQNSSFLDHYMDVPVDLSKVLFVCTANMTDTIPRPLLDRMEVISLSGYVSDEKRAIADRYLAPTAKKTAGLKDVKVTLTEEAIDELINKYCRESGVRSLKNHIEKIYRKSAYKIVSDLGEEGLSEAEALTQEGKAAQAEAEKNEKPQEAAKEEQGERKEPASSGTTAAETAEEPRVGLKVPDTVEMVIDKSNLKHYVGPPIFTSDRLYDVTPPGVVMGLAWTRMGGSAMYIEALTKNVLKAGSTAGFEITGNVKNVMKESSTLAYSYTKSLMANRFPCNHFMERAKIHMHVPEGAVQKDGPSGGITMTSSILSLALDLPLDPTVAMTGELTLTGKVLRIGGLREKTVAARRAGCRTIIFPQENLSDWLELPENVKKGLEGRPVSWYSEVFDILFSNLDHAKANTCKVCEAKKAEKRSSKASKAKKSAEEGVEKFDEESD